jgi:tRNA(Ile)-lysidine synthase
MFTIPPMQLVDRVRQFVRQHDLAPPGTRVVAALSGGSDSVALLHLLRALDAAGELTLVGAAHLNHQLRAAADADEQFARGVVRGLGLTAVVERADVRARAQAEHRSLEDAAHAVRHEFFERARRQLAADVVAVGHTEDDQAETFLLRLLRGAGPQGLGGMYPRRGTIIRPLLACRRRELRDYLDAHHIAYVEDESNSDVGIVRNRVRAELLPLLEARFNPAVVGVLADEALLAREVSQWLDEASSDLYGRVVQPLSPPAAPAVRLQIDLTGLAAAPRALARTVVRRAMTDAGGGRPIAFAHVDAVLRLAAGPRDGMLDAPGQRVDRTGVWLVLSGRPPGTHGRGLAGSGGQDAGGARHFRYPLSIPGEVLLPLAGAVVSAAPAEPVENAETEANVGAGHSVVVRRDLCRGALAVRNRRPGDRFRPIGLGGKKKLQDFFVDRKIARKRRDQVPLVVDESDRIVWVAGYGIDEAFRITDRSQGMLLLRLRLVGGSA